MRQLIVAVMAVVLVAGVAQAAPTPLSTIAQALERGDLKTLERVAGEQETIDDVAAVDPVAAVGMLLDIAETLAARGRFDAGLAAADHAVALVEKTWGENSLELVDPLRRRATLRLKRQPTAAANDVQRALMIVRVLNRFDVSAYADLEALQRQAWDLEGGIKEGGSGTPPPPPPPPPDPDTAPPPPPPGPPPPIAEPDPSFDLVEIFYATTRKRTGKPGAVAFYGGKRGKLEYGKAVVSVPREREVGALPTPSIWTLEFRPDPDKHFILDSITPITDRRTFLTSVSSRVGGSERKEVFVFVHGFNFTFEQGAMRTAQLAADLRIDGAPILWSWPSAGSVLGYRSDEKQAEDPAEASALAAFLEDIARSSGATRIHLVAHSMGNRPMMAALKLIAGHGALPPRPFDEIVFAAPDVGVREFDALWPQIDDLGERYTLYASGRDKALALSQRLNAMQRIGDATPIVVRPGLQTIDTTAASGGLLGHADFAGTALDDFRAVIWLSLKPGSRCVLSSEAGEAPWWRFGGQCPPQEFREVSRKARLAGSVEAALAEINGQIATTPSAERGPLGALRDRLLEIIAAR